MLATALVASIPTASAATGLHLDCQLTWEGQTRRVSFEPVSDPYRVASVQAGPHWRFKAVVIGTPEHVEFVSLYVTDLAQPRPTLVHQSTHHAPRLDAEGARATLTGRQRVYSSNLGREFGHECALRGGRP